MQDTGGEAGLSQGGVSARAGQRLPQERALFQDRRMRGQVRQVKDAGFRVTREGGGQDNE